MPANAMAARPLLSVRMRACLGDRHVSGAEDLVAADAAAETARQFVERALRGGPFDALHLHIDPIAEAPVGIALLPLFTVAAAAEATAAALHLLQRAGVDAGASAATLAALAAGAAGNGGNMRGAMLVDGRSGVRLEQNPLRGVRASRFGLDDRLREELPVTLAARGYPHHRTLEAWVLSAKMVAAPGALAEVCLSDDPDYTTGYVAIPGTAYVRIPGLKHPGNPHGGRALFLAPTVDAAGVTAWLQDRPCVVRGAAAIHPPQPLASVLAMLGW